MLHLPCVSVCRCVSVSVGVWLQRAASIQHKKKSEREREQKKTNQFFNSKERRRGGKNKSTSSLTAIRWIGLRLDWPALCWDYFGLDRIELDWMIIDFNGYQVDWGCFSCSDCTAIECNWVWIQLDSIALDSSFIFIDCVWVIRF